MITTSLDSQARPPAQPAEAEPSRAENKKSIASNSASCLDSSGGGPRRVACNSAQRAAAGSASQAGCAYSTTQRTAGRGWTCGASHVVCRLLHVGRCTLSVVCCLLQHDATDRWEGMDVLLPLLSMLLCNEVLCRTLCRTHVQNYAPCMVQCYAALPTGQYGAVLCQCCARCGHSVLCSTVVYYALCSAVCSRVVNPFTVLCTAMQSTA